MSHETYLYRVNRDPVRLRIARCYRVACTDYMSTCYMYMYMYRLLDSVYCVRCVLRYTRLSTDVNSSSTYYTVYSLCELCSDGVFRVLLFV